ncbi:MAG TPA: hypothetical protein VL048_17405 [Xanthobacteraceae bacterium]|nr:hypothetical protein [Xanthobacteraceae bacterium]
MPPAPYPDFRWFFRSLRALPIVALAALAGGIIGGFSVFALDLALTAPPSHRVSAEVGKITAEKAASSAATVPAAGTSAPPAPEQAAARSGPPATGLAPQGGEKTQAQEAQAQETHAQIAPQPQNVPHIAVTPPLTPQQATWPDALSHEHKAAPAAVAPSAALPTTAASTGAASVALQPKAASSGEPPRETQPSQAAQAADSGLDQPSKIELARKAMPPKRPSAVKPDSEGAVSEAAPRQVRSSSNQPVKNELAHKPIPAKRQVTVTRNGERTPSEGMEASARNGRSLYDSYGRSDAGPRHARVRYQYSNSDARSDRSGSPDARARYRSVDRRFSDRSQGADDDDDRSGDGYAEDSDRDGAMPPQPAPPPLFFGLFGGGDRYDDQ